MTNILSRVELEPLKYHQATLDFIGEKAVFSRRNFEILKDFERISHLELPPSLLEWFSLEQAHYILRKYSNTDYPVPIEQWIDYFLNSQKYDNPNGDVIPPATDKFIYLMGENQGCFNWSIHLDGSDDPPVYIDEVELTSPTFSYFVYTRVWDHSWFFSPHHETLLVNTDERLWFYGKTTEQDIAFMRENFEEVIHSSSSNYSEPYTYRFFKDDQYVLLGTGGKFDSWTLWAGSAQSLEMLVEELTQNIPLLH